MNSGDILNGRYRAVRKVDNGSMGEIWVVKDEQQNNIEVALKYCLSNEPGDLGRFKREVAIMSELQHDNVIKVIDANLDYEPPYFTMPLAKGNLWKYLRSIKGNISAILETFDIICNGVKALHDAGAYHRDINPDNVLYFEHNVIKVADLGLARKIVRGSKVHNSSRGAYGSSFYIAPEQLDALENADIRSDVYQLGKTLYAMLTNAHPSNMTASRVSPSLYYIIEKATRDNPDERYQTIKELQDEVKRFLPNLIRTQRPVDVFQELVAEAVTKLRERHLRSEDCLPILDALNNIKDDPFTFIPFFDLLPFKILILIVRELESEFVPILRAYDNNIDEYIREEKKEKYEYAETIANQLAHVFRNTTNLEIKRLSLKNILRYAVHFNRYDAMEVFDRLIQEIKDDNEAVMIALLLRENLDDYRQIYDRLAKRKLHPHLQTVYDEAENPQRIERTGTDTYEEPGSFPF